MNCRTVGIACQIMRGVASSASNGVVCRILAATTANTAIHSTQVNSRRSRNLVQSEKRR